MYNNEKELTQEESLLIIQRMINTAKVEQKDDGKGWILWGWMLFFTSVLTLVNTYFNWFNIFFFWNVFGLATIVIMLAGKVVAKLKRQKPAVKTYTQEIFDKLNIGFFICLMFIIIATNVGIRPAVGFPLLMNLYAFWILIYATVLNFKPSMVGAYIMWILAFAALLIPAKGIAALQLVMLLHAVGVFCGYIIPGHIAYRKFKQITDRKSI